MRNWWLKLCMKLIFSCISLSRKSKIYTRGIPIIAPKIEQLVQAYKERNNYLQIDIQGIK